MAEAIKMGLRAGKMGLGLQSSKEKKKSADTYKYYHKGKKTRKNLEYFIKLGIPENDAKVLAHVMSRARFFDGRRIGPFRFGAASFIGLFPALGDAIDGFLSLTIIKSASKVSGGLDRGVREKMVLNIALEILIGLTPVLGDLGDCVFQANTRNFLVLEKMLVKRVEKLQRAELHSEMAEVDPDHSHAHINGHHTSETAPPLTSRHDNGYAPKKELPMKALRETAQEHRKGSNGFARFGKKSVRKDHVQDNPNADIRSYLASSRPSR